MSDETGARRFPTTRWTRIQSVQSDDERRELLATLLRDYWKPLYFYARRKGLARDSAEDAVQGFCLQLMERDFLARLDRGRGRLRSFLRTSLNHYLANQHEKASAKKRGGDLTKITFDFDVAESDLSSVPEDPERAYERAWAASVMQRALEALEREFRDGSRSGPFEVVVQFFRFDEAPSYREVADAHDMTIPQLKAFLHRARKRYRELVEELVADTVSDTGETDDEVTQLVGA